MAGEFRSSYHHGNLRAALIDAGLTLLRSSGPGGLSLRAVARASGVSQAAPYKHFADKQALLAGLAEQGFLALHARFEALTPESDPRRRLQRLGAAYVRFALDEPALFQLMFSAELDALQDSDPGLAQAGARVYQALEQAVLAILPRDQQPDYARAGAWALVHGLSVLLLHGRIKSGAVGREQLIEGVTEQFVRGVLLGRN